jgi:hypothetical protein
MKNAAQATLNQMKIPCQKTIQTQLKLLSDVQVQLLDLPEANGLSIASM